MRQLIGTAHNIIPLKSEPIAELIILSDEHEYKRFDKSLVAERNIISHRTFVTANGLRSIISDLEKLLIEMDDIAAGKDGAE